MKKFLLISCLLISIVLNANSQSTSVRAFIDTNNVLIGDQLTLTLSAKASKQQSVSFPVVNDSIGKIVFLNTLKTDTTAEDKLIKYSRKYIITSFDSGEFVLPAFPVIISDKNQSDTILTNSLFLKFRTVQIDTSLGFKDIKPIMDVPWSFWDLLPYILVAAAAAIIVLLVLYLKKKFRKKPDNVREYDPDIPPNLLAMESLKQLEAEKLWQNGFVKKYHSQLSEIIRTYIERQFNILALEMTTIEIITELQKTIINIDSVFTLKRILELADMVKFAKYQPLPDEHSAALKMAFEFVEQTSITDNSASGIKEDKNV